MLNLSASAITGTWEFTDDKTTIAFFSDGNYQVNQSVNTDPNCSAGGIETGTYKWEPSTGILLVNVVTDNNKTCGLSNPLNGVPVRIFIQGNSMQVLEQGKNFNVLEFTAIRIAG